MRANFSILLGATVGYMSQNIAASNGVPEVAPFLGLGVAMTFIFYVLIGVSHG